MRLRFGVFEFDDHTGELRREGHLVKLPPQPGRVLALLVARAGQVVLREELRTHIWGNETFVDFERGLNFCILQVRTALGDSSENPRFVQTVPRKGYRFIAPVTADPVAVPVDAVQGGSTRPASAVSSRGRLPRYVALGIAVLAIVTPLAWLIAARGAPSDAGIPTRVRVAVLPFVNLTGDPEAEYIVDGVTDEIIAQLGRVSPERLAVIARTSVMRYRDTQKSVAEIGRELDVRYILEGSVRREAGRLRVATELVSAGDQAQVWSDVFERLAGDSMDLQTDVASRVARALALELVPASQTSALARSTRSADAWDAYLRGRYFLAQGRADAVRQALDQFDAAVRLDAQFAAAWAQLAEARHVLVMIGAVPPNDAYPGAADAARQALALDPTHADSHVANGVVQLWYNWQPAAAARAFERAITLNPSHAAAHHDYAWALVALERFDEAVAQITMARDLDPLSARANADIGWLHLHLRQPTEAVRACRHTLAIQPESAEAQACLERAYLQRGLHDQALRAALASTPEGEDVVAATAASAGDRVAAIWRWRLQRLQTAAKARWVSAYQLAVHHAFVGELEAAMDALERAYAERAGVLVFLKSDPAVDRLRSMARFQSLQEKVRESAR